ncbi:MAG TPA: TetR family transcriptional regulator, partial [Vineibacter sp.]|nr:TetR family transcriptional regulator [Vineibacter sp.]
MLRGIRTRQAIISATRELFLAGGREPTLEDVARRAGVSPRILLKYFSGFGGVIVAMVIQVLDELVARYGAFRGGTALEQRIAGYVDLRGDICEQFTPLLLRTVQMARHIPEIDGLIQRGRGNLREFAMDVFGRELRGLPPSIRRDLFDELAMISDWNNWRYLREACGRSPEEAK